MTELGGSGAENEGGFGSGFPVEVPTADGTPAMPVDAIESPAQQESFGHKVLDGLGLERGGLLAAIDEAENAVVLSARYALALRLRIGDGQVRTYREVALGIQKLTDTGHRIEGATVDEQRARQLVEYAAYDLRNYLNKRNRRNQETQLGEAGPGGEEL